jgi:hypothetical protein
MARWNADIERIELDRPFSAGSRITMTPVGQEPVELRIAEVAEPHLFVDEAVGVLHGRGVAVATCATEPDWHRRLHT